MLLHALQLQRGGQCSLSEDEEEEEEEDEDEEEDDEDEDELLSSEWKSSL